MAELESRRERLAKLHRDGVLSNEQYRSHLHKLERYRQVVEGVQARERAFRETLDRAHALTPEEAEALTRAVHQCGCLEHERSLGYLLQSWSTFVAAVEQGYDDMCEEYFLDLSHRDYLEYILLALPTSPRDKLMSLIGPLDERFDRATQPAADGSSFGGELFLEKTGVEAWWLYRVPRKLEPELMHDLFDIGCLYPVAVQDPREKVEQFRSLKAVLNVRRQEPALPWKIIRIVRRHDPLGLRRAKPTSYWPEVATILPRLDQAGSVGDVRRIVSEEFAAWCGPELAQPEGRYEGIARDIWSVLQACGTAD